MYGYVFNKLARSQKKPLADCISCCPKSIFQLPGILYNRTRAKGEFMELEGNLPKTILYACNAKDNLSLSTLAL